MLSFGPRPEDVDPAKRLDLRAKALGQLRRNEPLALLRGTLADLWRWHDARAIMGVPARPAARIAARVDWTAWRAGFEYLCLYWRLGPPPLPNCQSVVHASLIYEMALTRCLLGREDMAAALLAKSGGGAEVMMKGMNLAPRKDQVGPGDLGVFGLLYRRLGCRVPQHAAFSPDDSLLTPEGRARILEARKVYARSGRAAGTLLAGFAYARLPLDLIWLDSLMPPESRDPELALLADAIAAASYPEDEVLDAVETRLRIEGL